MDNIEEKKQYVISQLVKMEEDKFTRTKTYESTRKAEWSWKKHTSLSIKPYYIHRNEEDTILLSVAFKGRDTGFIGLNSLTLHFVTAEGTTINLYNSITYDHTLEQDEDLFGKQYTDYIEVVQLDIPIDEFIKLSTSNSAEISIRTKAGRLYEGKLEDAQFNVFKGFYTAVFDPDHKIDEVHQSLVETDKPKGGACYIATAVYGSYDHPKVRILRTFRDSTLSKTGFGRAFIKLYYRTSPALAEKVKNRAGFNFLVRRILDGVVSLIEKD